MPRSLYQNTNNVKDQTSIFSPKPIISAKMFTNECYLNKLQDTQFKRTTLNFTKEFKEFKNPKRNSTMKLSTGPKEKKNKQ